MHKLSYTIGELLMTEVEDVDNVSYNDGNMVVHMCDGTCYTLHLTK